MPQRDQELPDRPLNCTVLPTYNERDNIRQLIEGVLDNAMTPHMVLVVDDDSPDGTWQVVEAVAVERNRPNNEVVHLVRRTTESGLTSAIQRGIDEAIQTFGADVVTWMDCDLSMPPEDVPKLVSAIVNADAGAGGDSPVDVAVGSRWVPGGADVAHGFMARSLSRVINTYAATLLGNDVHDYTSGFIAARAEVLETIRLRGDYGEYCIDLLGRAIRLGYNVVEVPYVCVPRTAGDSKTGANLLDYLAKGRKYVSATWRVYREESS
jgi:dolichol-phosphate mannosyltransferase